MSEFPTPGHNARDESPARFRPAAVAAVPLAAVGQAVGVAVPAPAADVEITGISINSRTVEPGDLYVALPGATRHGA
ncbi:MAG: UDP-N-acetylmuramoyl-L-alanyl-D-glutamate--2,6-diaminopimelate ligase, partial [Actinomycetes bacterium]